jgi:hypothetical protein
MNRDPQDVSIGDRLRSDLMAAMKAKDGARTRVLRSALAAIDNAGAVEAPAEVDAELGYGDVPRRPLDAATARALLEEEILEREVGVTEYLRVDRRDEAETLRAEIATLRTYLDDM